MALRSRILLVLGGAVGTIGALAHMAREQSRDRIALDCEERLSQAAADRARDLLHSELESLALLGTGLACSDALSAAVTGEPVRSIDVDGHAAALDLEPERLRSWRLDIVYLLATDSLEPFGTDQDARAAIRFAAFADPRTREALDSGELLPGGLPGLAGRLLLDGPDAYSRCGIVPLGDRTLLLSSHRVRTPDGMGGGRGGLLLGRFVESTKVPTTEAPLAMADGSSTAGTDLVAACTLVLVLLGLLEWLVVRPLSRLAGRTGALRDSRSVEASRDGRRSDEFGSITRDLDKLAAQFEQMRQSLAESSLHAGRYEIAAGILHNVGNVLNSVNVSATLASQHLDEFRIDDLEKLSAVLEEHADDLVAFVSDDARGKHLEPFLKAICGQLSEQRQLVSQEFASLSSGLEHVCELVRSQQSHAGKGNTGAALDLKALIAEAIHICRHAQSAHSRIEFTLEVGAVGSIQLDKHRLLEILVNLIQNAAQSVIESACAAPAVHVTVKRERDTLVFRVEDNGRGIAPDVLPRLFSLGFTTRPNGLGYGLHSAAKVAAQMGGSITPHSAGPGLGATFVVSFPLPVSPTSSKPSADDSSSPEPMTGGVLRP